MRLEKGPHRLLALVLTASVLLAGCTSSDDADDPEDPPDQGTGDGGDGGDTDGGDSSVDTAGVRPLWFLGLQWTYDVTFHRVGASGSMAVAVVRDDGDTFQISADATEDLLKWALVSHMPPLGPIKKVTFEPNIHETQVHIFDFPLQDGKVWNAPDHRGTQVNFTAMRTETALPDGRSVTAYDVTGERGGSEWIRYTYTAEVGWFTFVTVDNNDDGMADVTMTLTEATASQAHRSVSTFEPTELALFRQFGVDGNSPDATPFTVPEDVDDLFVFFVMGGGPGRYQGTVTLPGGATHDSVFVNSNQTVQSVIKGHRFDPEPGPGDLRGIIVGDGFVGGEAFSVVRRAPDA